MRSELEEGYGFLFEKELLDEIIETGSIQSAKQGEVKGINLSITDKRRKDDDGDELALYYLERGDTCTMTMTCCMGQKTSKIKAVAETDTRFIVVPVIKMKEWLKKYDSWMAYVFESYNNRFNELLEAIDNLAFNNMHDRLYKHLKEQVLIKKTTVLEISHQDIAYDLHTSRVVISRLLKSLEKEGLIELGRNKIIVIEF